MLVLLVKSISSYAFWPNPVKTTQNNSLESQIMLTMFIYSSTYSFKQYPLKTNIKLYYASDKWIYLAKTYHFGIF